MTTNYDINDLIQNMIDLESDGKGFYTEAAKYVADSAIRDMFQNLARQEDAHKILYCSLLNEFEEVVEVDDDYHFFLKQVVDEYFAFKSTAPDNFEKIVEVLDFAIKLEKDSIKFLTEFEKLLSGERQELIDRIKEEEATHLIILTNLREQY